jgi:hypothetical protein
LRAGRERIAEDVPLLSRLSLRALLHGATVAPRPRPSSFRVA